MSLHGRILNLACHWQASNFDIKHETLEVQPFPLPSSFLSSRQRYSSPPSRLSRPSRPPQPLCLEFFEMVEELRESVDKVTLTPVYQRRRQSIGTPGTIPKPSVNLGDPEYCSIQRASSTELRPARRALETVWEVESESEAWDIWEYKNLTVDSRNDELSTTPDSRFLGRAYIVQSDSYATLRNEYSGKTEDFDTIMEQMKLLYSEASDLEWEESRKDELPGSQCNQERLL